MLQKLTDQWQHDWHNRKVLFFLEVFGTVSSITASVLVSFWPGVISLAWVFLFWLIGSVLLATSAYLRSTAWPMCLMIIYTFLNIIGIYNIL